MATIICILRKNHVKEELVTYDHPTTASTAQAVAALEVQAVAAEESAAVIVSPTPAEPHAAGSQQSAAAAANTASFILRSFP